MKEHAPKILSATTMIGDEVRNPKGEKLGKIEEIMIDRHTGNVAYAVLSFGGLMGIGDKLFAVPWEALRVDTGEHEFVMDVDKERLENAPGFDKNDWPSSPDRSFLDQVHSYYDVEPYYAARV